MRHKTIVEDEDGHKYRTDDPDCTCRKCLLGKLERTKKSLKQAEEELKELCENPDSEKSKSIRRIHFVYNATVRNFCDVMWFGSIGAKKGRGIFDMIQDPKPFEYSDNPSPAKALDDLMGSTTFKKIPIDQEQIGKEIEKKWADCKPHNYIAFHQTDGDGTLIWHCSQCGHQTSSM